MIDKDLLKPSLTEENTVPTESYNINKLLYVAFFGGVIPTIWLGTKNAKWLNIHKNKINLLIGVGLIFLILKMTLVWMSLAKLFVISTRTIKWVYRGISLLLYFGYYLVMKKDFEQHIFFGGEIRPMFKEAILPFVVAIIVEAALLAIITSWAGVI